MFIDDDSIIIFTSRRRKKQQLLVLAVVLLPLLVVWITVIPWLWRLPPPSSMFSRSSNHTIPPTHDCPWDEATCAFATMNGHLNVKKWCREHGCPWDSKTHWWAKNNLYPLVAQWCQDNGCPTTKWELFSCIARFRIVTCENAYIYSIALFRWNFILYLEHSFSSRCSVLGNLSLDTILRFEGDGNWLLA